MMRKYFLIGFMLFALAYFATSQTATNFNVPDCSGQVFDLYSELNEGKVIVICWVMPCSSSISGAVSSYNVVDSYQESHPEKVYYYLADDYADTPCSQLSGWANSFNIPESSFSRRFSNPAIDMNDYGGSGMPKVVVVGGSNYQVYYNGNDGNINHKEIQDAINLALENTSINNYYDDWPSAEIFPSPVHDFLNLRMHGFYENKIYVSLFDMNGRLIYSSPHHQNGAEIQIDCSEFEAGMYFIELKSNSSVFVDKFIKIR